MEQNSKNIIALTVALALGTIATEASARPADSIVHTNRPIVTNSGEVEYRITLDPLYAATLEIPAKLKGFIRHALTADQFYTGNEAIEEPTVRYLAYTIADIIHKKPHNIMSWAGTEFRLMARPKEIQALFWHEGIVGIAEVDESEYEPILTFSQSSPVMAAGDYYSKNEIVPWWVLYTNSIAGPFNGGTIVKQIDGPVTGYPGHLAEINYVYVNNDWDKLEWQTQSNYQGFWHSLHVAGVMGAIENDFGIRGINPGQQIYLYGGNPTPASVAERLNFIIASSEASFSWDVINMSMNMEIINDFNGNMFELGKKTGRMMAIASNNNLVVQSAGNHNNDACLVAYNNGNANPLDGIVVVGGHDINGQRSTDDNIYFNYALSPESPWKPVPASNYGRCVDLWAPSKQITSLRYGYPMGGMPATQVMSGTSFAAPIAAAIAARYGNYLTRPIERESFLRAYAQSTGAFDPAGLPIKSVKWSYSNIEVLKRYPISGVWSPRDNKNINMLYDGLYQGVWNSMGYEGTLVIDLGQTRKVNVIRVTLRSSVVDQDSPIDPKDNYNPAVDFTVAAAASPTSTEYLGTPYSITTPRHFDRVPFSIVLATPITSRYLILKGNNHGSWLAYSEIEAYGY